MEHLIGNGTHLYKRSVSSQYHLVRTPIVISLPVSEMAWYAVAGGYDSGDWPIHGYLDGMTYANTLALGSQCVYDSLNPNNHMYWRKVTNNHPPETVWYQGAYGTSASSRSLATISSEAYMQFCAYRFVVPPSLASLVVKSVEVSFVNGGGIQCYGPAYNRSSQNRTIRNLGGTFRSYYMPFFVSEYIQGAATPIRNPAVLWNDYPYDTAIDIFADNGDGFTGDRNLWNFTGTNRDGGIPALRNPPTKTYTMGASTLQLVNAYRDFWITPIFGRAWNGAGIDQYNPQYVENTGGWWACFSVWGISVKVSLGAPN